MTNTIKTDIAKKHNSLFIIIVGFIVAFGRIILIEKNQDDITIIMSVVNVVAFGFVLLFMCNDLYDRCKNKIFSCGTDTNVKKRIKLLLELFFIIFLIVYTISGVKYVSKYKSPKYNDAMSIIALAFSIANDGLIKYLTDPLYKFLFGISSIIDYIQKTFKKQK